MDLAAGTRLGPYEIDSRIGAGGMGTVYRARDTRLDRSVAVKVLPAHASDDPRMRARLALEARAVSALSHPNICALYDVGSSDGIDYLVMELLDGESVAQRLARGPLPIQQAVRIGREIALALDAAHRAGLVHRDLKPGNVMITRNGARLLDFGLAKAIQPSGPPDSEDATMQTPLTREGAVVGTLRYMAPEQIEGREVDARTDVFAFGLLLYEMVTGRPAFSGPNVTAAILTEQPPSLREVSATTAVWLEKIIARCLQKDPEERWQSMRDLAEALQWAGDATGGSVAAVTAPRRAILVPALLVAVVAALAAIAATMMMRGKREDASEIRFAVNPPPGTNFSQRAIMTELAVSPDGKSLVLVAEKGQHPGLYLRRFDSMSAQLIAGSEGGFSPFWSPDGKWIGFFSGGSLKKVPAAGGDVQIIAPAKGGGASWGRGDNILFFEYGDATEATELVPASGGAVRKVTPANDGWCMWPSFLPDGRHFIFFWLRNPPMGGLYVTSIDGGEPRLVVQVPSRGEVRGDQLYYVRNSVLVRQKFDLETFKVAGDPVKIGEKAFCFTPTAMANFSVASSANVIAYQRHPLPTQLVWRDSSGRELGKVGKPELYRKFSLSSDGRRVVFDMFDPGTQKTNIWLYNDVDRAVPTRLTNNERSSFSPIWARRGDAVLFSNGDGEHLANAPDIVMIALQNGSVRKLTDEGGPVYANDVTPDGSTLIYSVTLGREWLLRTQSMTGELRPVPITTRPGFEERDAVVSPDQRWLAFQSDESGEPAIYIVPFRGNGEKVRVSSGGGTEPRWSHDGRAVYYIAPNGILVCADVESVPTLRVTKETNLFPVTSASILEFQALGVSHYDVARDRILVRELVDASDADPVTVIMNAR